jgi:hypothetical protein
MSILDILRRYARTDLRRGGTSRVTVLIKSWRASAIIIIITSEANLVVGLRHLLGDIEEHAVLEF